MLRAWRTNKKYAEQSTDGPGSGNNLDGLSKKLATDLRLTVRIIVKQPVGSPEWLEMVRYSRTNAAQYDVLVVMVAVVAAGEVRERERHRCRGVLRWRRC